MSETMQLSEHIREEIEKWKARFPEDRHRSAVIGALHAAQHENEGYLTQELMDAVGAYLDMPPVQVYEVASFYSMFETEKVGEFHHDRNPFFVIARSRRCRGNSWRRSLDCFATLAMTIRILNQYPLSSATRPAW